MEFDRFSRLKENMVSAGDGWYVSGQDPRIWQKLLERNPNDGKALYNVGLHYGSGKTREYPCHGL